MFMITNYFLSFQIFLQSMFQLQPLIIIFGLVERQLQVFKSGLMAAQFLSLSGILENQTTQVIVFIVVHVTSCYCSSTRYALLLYQYTLRAATVATAVAVVVHVTCCYCSTWNDLLV